MIRKMFKTLFGKLDSEYLVDVYFDSGIGDYTNEGAYAEFAETLIKNYTYTFNKLPSVGEIIRESKEDYVVKNVCIDNDNYKVEIVIAWTEWVWD